VLCPLQRPEQLNSPACSCKQNGFFLDVVQDSLYMNDVNMTHFLSQATQRLQAGADGAAEAARLLFAGGLVAIPTETVYGLAADATNAAAVARIYEAKGRPVFNPLIAHVADADEARRHGVFDADALALAARFWPGPLTLVVPVSAQSGICELARAGLDSVGLRVPSHPVAQDVLRKAGLPLAAPSANRSGHVSPTMAAHVLADLDGRIDAVLDGGPCDVGIESTIVACLGGGPILLRAGGITRQRLEAVLGRELAVHNALNAESGASPLAPGMLSSHYAPRAKLRLNAGTPQPGEAWLGFGACAAGQIDASLNLSPTGNLTEAAANLYGYLRKLDSLGMAGIAAASIPDCGVGEAINDRLRRASSPKV
jgi:L-threonylcarbamoyladenylate synthase